MVQTIHFSNLTMQNSISFSEFLGCPWFLRYCKTQRWYVGDKLWRGITSLFLTPNTEKKLKWKVQGLNFQIHILVYFRKIGLGFKKFFLSNIVIYEKLPADFWHFEIFIFFALSADCLKYTYTHKSSALITAMALVFPESLWFSSYSWSKLPNSGIYRTNFKSALQHFLFS